MNKNVRIKELYNCTTEYLTPLFSKYEFPWEMLPVLKEYISSLIAKGIDGFTKYSDNVLIGENVKIYPNVTIEGPAIIGAGTEIRPGAFIRGSVITGKNCVIAVSVKLAFKLGL